MEVQYMATRTAPTVNGTPTFKRVSVTLYDYTGEQRTDTYQLDAAATDVQIEAFIAALQVASNGTIWRVIVGDVYNSVGDPSNADEEVWEEATSNVVLLAKTSANASQDWYIPAPDNGLFLEGTENIDPSNTDLGDVMTAILAMRSGYSFVSARFTSRRDIGTKINF
jgi:hypothetical protein